MVNKVMIVNISDKVNPSFICLLKVNNRTAWKPFGLPVILVIPSYYDLNGNRIPGAGVSNTRLYIEERRDPFPVAGHDNIGVTYPDAEVYEVPIGLSNRLISHIDYYDDNGTEVTPDSANYIEFDAKDGNTYNVEYLPNAAYFDLTNAVIETEDLPSGQYNLVYECSYNTRTFYDNQIICVLSNEKKSVFKFIINHPGEVIESMVRHTPDAYFDGVSKANDSTIGFYRAMISDLLQDIHDEHSFLRSINWVDFVQPQYIPYLSSLLGWDLPYFPKSIDELRKAILKTTVKLQQAKGSARAVNELFEVLGFIIKIYDVYWNGDVLVGKDENNIELERNIILELLLNEYNIAGFGDIDIPLLYKPSVKQMYIDVYMVKDSDNQEFVDLASQLAAPGSLNVDYIDGVIYDLDYVLNSNNIAQLSGLDGVVDWGRIKVASTGQIDVVRAGVIGNADINWLTSSINIEFDRYYDFSDYKAYAFATYVSDSLNVPSKYEISNRFDVEILKRGGSQVESDVIDFLIDFLFRIKAFHSLLRKVIYSIGLDDVYLVTDFCVGGDVEQRGNIDAGKQQIPPAIIPLDEECLAPTDLGYKTSDLEYRSKILSALANEFDRWKNVRSDRLCQFNKNGQDRTQDDRQQQANWHFGDLVLNDANQSTLCNLNDQDYCYKGRASDKLVVDRDVANNEVWHDFSCNSNLGVGFYYEYNGNIYYTNDNRFDGWDPRSHLALSRPSLDISKAFLTFPGHRLPSLNKLENDYTSEWYFKPWDFDAECGCPTTIEDLNLTIYVGSDGDEYLSFDLINYALTANSLEADISTLGFHGLGLSLDYSDITHKVYADLFVDNGYASFDSVIQSIGVIDVDDPLFESACENSGGYEDYSEGYAADTGYYSYVVDFDYTRYTDETSDQVLVDLLGLPEANETSYPLLYRLNSEIKVDADDPLYQHYKPMRLDCGCLTLCGDSITCNTQEHDIVTYDQTMSLSEEMHPYLLLLNEDYLLFEFLENNPSGQFSYQDGHKIVYDLKWQTINNIIRLEVIKKDPNIPGQDPIGKVIGTDVYRYGLITTEVYRITNKTISMLISSDISRDWFISKYGCNTPFVDPFAYDLNNSPYDSLEYEIDGVVWDSSEWESSTGDSLEWIDIFT